MKNELLLLLLEGRVGKSNKNKSWGLVKIDIYISIEELTPTMATT